MARKTIKIAERAIAGAAWPAFAMSVARAMAVSPASGVPRPWTWSSLWSPPEQRLGFRLRPKSSTAPGPGTALWARAADRRLMQS